MAMVGVIVGAYLTWLKPIYYTPIMSAIAAGLVCAAGNVINDLVDIKIDTINHPERILVRGTLSKRYALWLGSLLNILAVIVAFSVNLPVTLIAVSAILLLYFYNYFAKRIIILGNVIIALLAALIFITGGIAVDYKLAFYLPGPLVGSLFAFLFHLVREIVKDIEDIKGDRKAGIRTFPQIFGIQKSLMVVIFLFLILVVFTYVPVIRGWFGSWYKIITVYIVDLPLLAFLIFLWGNPSPKMLRIGSIWLKIGMGLGIIALLGA